MMKRYLNLILITLVVALSSCKKDKTSDLTSVEGISKALATGYWQHSKYKSGSSTEMLDVASYWVYQFKSGNTYDSYYAKGEKYDNDRPYRVKMYDGRVVFVQYRNQDSYKQDQHSDSNTYDIYFKDGELYLENKTYNSIDVYKNYRTLNAAKDLPPST